MMLRLFLTVSIGLAYLNEVGEVKIEEIIKCGDDALYKAKDMGRNSWHLHPYNNRAP